MINDKHKFIFIHIRKTGGTSIEEAFIPSAGHGKNEVPHKHLSALDLKNMFPEKWHEYFKFTFVRNPWDWLVSRYMWSSRNHKYITCKTFKEFIVNLYTNKIEGFPSWILKSCEPQINMLSDRNKVIVDNIYKFENLNSDFKTVCNLLNIPKKTLPHNSKSKHNHYSEYYDEETKQIVAEKYLKDIEYFGYKFGE